MPGEHATVLSDDGGVGNSGVGHEKLAHRAHHTRREQDGKGARQQQASRADHESQWRGGHPGQDQLRKGSGQHPAKEHQQAHHDGERHPVEPQRHQIAGQYADVCGITFELRFMPDFRPQSTTSRLEIHQPDQRQSPIDQHHQQQGAEYCGRIANQNLPRTCHEFPPEHVVSKAWRIVPSAQNPACQKNRYLPFRTELANAISSCVTRSLIASRSSASSPKRAPSCS